MAGPAGLPEGAVSLGSSIGRYFGLVSMLPAVLLVLFVLALSESGAWSDRPSATEAAAWVAELGLQDAALVLLLSLVVALFLHPLQFPFTQLLEGYWGTSSLAGALATDRTAHHRTRYRTLDELQERTLHELARVALDLPDTADGRAQAAAAVRRERQATGTRITDRLNSEAGDDMAWIAAYLRHEEAARLQSHLPIQPARCMPTRLGNVLRRYEDLAGLRYGLDAVDVVPRLAVLAPARHTDYLQDSREALDLAIRLCLVSGLAAATAVAALATDGLWLLVALVPLVGAYVAYLGAVAAAHEYGTALCVVVDLNRFGLYEGLRWPAPGNLDDERSSNMVRSRALTGPVSRAEAVTVTYVDNPDTTVEVRARAAPERDPGGAATPQ